MISAHFGEQWESTDCDRMCDHCSENATSGSDVDVSDVAEAARNILNR
jgi:hypothetical protein